MYKSVCIQIVSFAHQGEYKELNSTNIYDTPTMQSLFCCFYFNFLLPLKQIVWDGKVCSAFISVLKRTLEDSVIQRFAVASTDYLSHWLCGVGQAWLSGSARDPEDEVMPSWITYTKNSTEMVLQKWAILPEEDISSDKSTYSLQLLGTHSLLFSPSSPLPPSKFSKESFIKTKSFSDSKNKIKTFEARALPKLAVPSSRAHEPMSPKSYTLLHASMPFPPSYHTFPLAPYGEDILFLCVSVHVVFLLSFSLDSLSLPPFSHIIFPVSGRAHISHNETERYLQDPNPSPHTL